MSTEAKRIKFARPILISQSDTLHLETQVWAAVYAAALALGTTASVAERADAAVIAWRERVAQ